MPTFLCQLLLPTYYKGNIKKTVINKNDGSSLAVRNTMVKYNYR